MADIRAFVQQYAPVATSVAQKIGVAPETLLGQWGLETGWGQSVVPGTHNLGNIKDLTGSGVAARENLTGRRDRYRAYDSPQAFGNDYADLITRRYPNAVGVGNDTLKYARALKFGGYAQDPAYIQKVVAATDTVRQLGDFLASALSGTAHAAVPTPQTTSLRSKIQEARANGYSDAQIAQYLQQSKTYAPRFDEARKQGYSEADIFNYLGLKVDAATQTPSIISADSLQAQPNDTLVKTPSFLEKAGHQLGLTGRAIVSSVGGARRQTSQCGRTQPCYPCTRACTDR